MGIHISLIKPVMVAYKSNSPEFPDSSHIRLFRTAHSEDRLGGLFFVYINLPLALYLLVIKCNLDFCKEM